MPKSSVNAHFEATCDLLVVEVPSLATALHFELVPTAHSVPSGELVVGSIGFAGRDMRGAVTLAAAAPFWEGVAPEELGTPIGSAMLCDLVGETCNLVVGRFRNSLLRHGVEVACATPTSTFGRLHDLKCPCVQHSTWRTFRSSAGDLYLRLDVSFDESFSLPTTTVVEPSVQELVLF
jgi:hypothetical protein